MDDQTGHLRMVQMTPSVMPCNAQRFEPGTMFQYFPYTSRPQAKMKNGKLYSPFTFQSFEDQTHRGGSLLLHFHGHLIHLRVRKPSSLINCKNRQICCWENKGWLLCFCDCLFYKNGASKMDPKSQYLKLHGNKAVPHHDTRLANEHWRGFHWKSLDWLILDIVWINLKYQTQDGSSYINNENHIFEWAHKDCDHWWYLQVMMVLVWLEPWVFVTFAPWIPPGLRGAVATLLGVQRTSLFFAPEKWRPGCPWNVFWVFWNHNYSNPKRVVVTLRNNNLPVSTADWLPFFYPLCQDSPGWSFGPGSAWRERLCTKICCGWPVLFVVHLFWMMLLGVFKVIILLIFPIMKKKHMVFAKRFFCFTFPGVWSKSKCFCSCICLLFILDMGYHWYNYQDWRIFQMATTNQSSTFGPCVWVS